MNKGYKYIDGNIIVENEKGCERVLNYQDNIDEILVKENVIEEIQKELNACNYALGVQKKMKKTKYNNTKTFFNIFLPVSIVPILLTVLNVSVNLTIVGVVIAFIEGICFTVCDIMESKEIDRYINALKVTINKNTKLLGDETKKLDELRKDNAKVLSSQIKTDERFKEKNEARLFRLSKLQQLYYNTGYDIKYLYELEKNGVFDSVMHVEYNSEELLIMKDIVKEEGPVLVKTRKNLRNKR